MIQFHTEEMPYGELITAELRITATAIRGETDKEEVEKALKREIAYLLAEKMLA